MLGGAGTGMDLRTLSHLERAASWGRSCARSTRDTEVGWPEGLDISRTDPLGLQFVSLSIEQPGGTLTLVCGGTSFALALPLPRS
jgi:two-component sensor histidine kinase